MSNPLLTRGFSEPAGTTATLERPVGTAGYAPLPTPELPTYPGGPMAADVGGRAMTYGGTASVAALMLCAIGATGYFGWQSVVVTRSEPLLEGGKAIVSTSLTNGGWLIGSVIIGLILGIGTAFVPKAARFTALPYAAAQGYMLGAISHLYDSQSSGIAVQAFVATVGVTLVMLLLYGLRILRATPKMVKGIIAATFGVMAIYLVSFLGSLFSPGFSLLGGSGALGIAISLVIVGIAAFNLILDFDLIERGVKEKFPAYMEWYAAFGLMVTLIWLYLELLRLLSKLRD